MTQQSAPSVPGIARHYSQYKLRRGKPVQHKNGAGAFAKVEAFQKPVTSRGSKLYVIKSGRTILYVGITSQSIAKRLRYGFTATGKDGYRGYKWKTRKEILDVLVWCFPGRPLRFVESIEAEVVFGIRRSAGAWPACQTEIHFHQTTTTERLLADWICRSVIDAGSDINPAWMDTVPSAEVKR